jgi:hypothetical protein
MFPYCALFYFFISFFDICITVIEYRSGQSGFKSSSRLVLSFVSISSTRIQLALLISFQQKNVEIAGLEPRTYRLR